MVRPLQQTTVPTKLSWYVEDQRSEEKIISKNCDALIENNDDFMNESEKYVIFLKHNDNHSNSNNNDNTEK